MAIRFERTSNIKMAQALPRLVLVGVWLAVAADAIAVTSPAGETTRGLVILPHRIELDQVGSHHKLAVHWLDPQGRLLGPVESPLSWRLSDPEVASIDGQRLVATGAGKARLVVEVTSGAGEALRAEAEVSVADGTASRRWEFTNHVQAVLSRRGCNMGACHGALSGKGGFRLSLHGYDPAADHYTITREGRGRRVELAAVNHSLLLTKPTGEVPHKGGTRLPADSDDYRLLKEWLQAGGEGPRDDDPLLDRVEVLPGQLWLRPGDQFHLVVRAHYRGQAATEAATEAAGRIEDVSQWAKFSSADQAVAVVDDQGLVQIVGPGQGTLVVWFGSHIAMCRVTVPFERAIEESMFERLESSNLIDRLVLDQLRQLQLAPSPGCSDLEFIRRAYIDTLGRLPDPGQIERFAADTSPDKRHRLVDELLHRTEQVDYWSYRWSDLLMINGTLLRPAAVKSFYSWVRQQVQQNRPWDQFVREIVTASGESLEQGATNFYALHQDPEAMTENVCQAFLSLSIGCAKCHNHPLEKWTNDQYYAMASMFARVQAKGWGGDSRGGDGARTLVVLDAGEVIQPIRGRPQPPAPLDAPPLDFDWNGDRREYLADWLTAPENRYFTRAIVNRVWANFFGLGLVNPVDDLRASNPASNPALLDALERYLIEHDYDLKALMRLILTSATYQRSAVVLEENQADRQFFSRHFPRRLMAEVLHDAVVEVTQVPTHFREIEFDGADRSPTDFYPLGTRAFQLYDSAVSNYFLKSFGRHQRRITCECERSDEPSVVQVLHLSNGVTLNDKLAAPGNQLDRWLAEFDQQPLVLIDQAFLASLSRWPTAQERAELLAEWEATPETQRRELLEDMLWGLMTCREFLFSH
jgi:hypothetical protein